MPTDNQLLYEFPCNEKVRTYLRLESLFNRYNWFCEQDCGHAHTAAISTLFDLLDASARSDLRHDLIQTLERMRQRCVAEDAADAVAEITSVSAAVSGSVGKTAQSIRENQWLQLIRARQTIAGGTCEFDIPQLHRWLNLPARSRRAELQSYIDTLTPVRSAVQLVLRQLRSVEETVDCTAQGGVYQHTMPRNHTAALVRLTLPAQSNIIPEVSANKYMLWIRFSRPDEAHKLHPVRDNDIAFTLSLCNAL